MLKKALNFKEGIPNEYTILFSTRFVTKNILDYIVENTHGMSLINTPEYSITTFLIGDKEIDNDIYDIENRVKFFLKQIKPSIAQLPIKIYWFPTHFLKIIPLDKKSLDVNEINSACTIHFGSVSNSLIVIYRHEEAKKVLFHELIHLFSLDANIPSKLEYKIRNQYNLKNALPCSLAETYAEFIGCLLNIYYISEGNSDKFNKYLAIEQAFSLYQVNKILNFFNINDINRLNKLSSDTNLMTYYFLKTALLTHPNVNNFFYSLIENKFILDKHHLAFFEKYLDNLQNIPKYLTYLQNIKLDEQSMRMTIVE